MNDNEYGGFIERKPLSDKLSVDSGTKKARTAIERPRREGIQGGLTSLGINYQTPVKRRRKGQPDHLSEGVEAESINDVLWEQHMESPEEFGFNGEEKHMAQLLYENGYGDDSEETQFF